MLFADIRVSQLLSVILFIGAIIIVIYRRRLGNQIPMYLDGDPFRKKAQVAKNKE